MDEMNEFESSFDNGEGRYLALTDDEGKVIPGSAVNIVRCGVCQSAVFDLSAHANWHKALRHAVMGWAEWSGSIPRSMI